MSVIATVKPQEDFIVQMNGDYNIAFDEVALAADAAAGDVVEVGDGFGIVAKAGVTGAVVRVMVRGNPTTVDGSKLNYGALVEADAQSAFKAAGIILV